MNEVKTPKKPLMYYYVVAMLLVLLFNFIAMPWLMEHRIKQVDYNTFVSMTESGEIGQVEIQEQDNRILFTDKEETAVYKTAMIPDDELLPRLLEAGMLGMIGKGPRSEAVRAALMARGGVYFAATGGAGALLARCVESAELVAYPELGPEALRRLVVRELPLVVALDSAGGDLYVEGPAAYLAALGEK